METKRKYSVTEKKSEVIGSLKDFGLKIYEQMEKGDFPSITMPSRSTQNIYYDMNLRQFILGDKSVRRSARNIRHVKPFTQ
ncbi:MAG: DNA topoisomerase IV subunit A, partial [Candidatus Bathyarchaeales archaeon]